MIVKRLLAAAAAYALYVALLRHLTGREAALTAGAVGLAMTLAPRNDFLQPEWAAVVLTVLAVAATAARETASLAASLRRLEGLKRSADAELAFADKALAVAKTDQARAQAEDRKQKAVPKAAQAATEFDTAKADAKSKLDAAAAAKDAAKAAEKRKADLAKAASEAKLALEPVSIYISRATQ